MSNDFQDVELWAILGDTPAKHSCSSRKSMKKLVRFRNLKKPIKKGLNARCQVSFSSFDVFQGKSL